MADENQIEASADAATAPANPQLASGATWTLWTIVGAVLLFGVVAPAGAESSRFSTGYFRGCDWPIQPFLSTLILIGALIVFALAKVVFRLGVQWRQFVFALAVFASTIAIANAAVHGMYHAAVQRFVSKAQSVVDAIHEFEGNRGHAPGHLSELAPHFLPVDPSTDSDEPTLEYEPRVLGSTVPPGAWAIRSNPMDSVHLEYVPRQSTRLLLPTEERMGDWVVDARAPYGPLDFGAWISGIAERLFASSTEFGSGTEMCARCGARRDVRTRDGVPTNLVER